MTETEGSLKLDHYAEIHELNCLVLEARQLYLGAKDKASTLKKEYDRLVDDLIETIASGLDRQIKLPFDAEQDAGSDDWRNAKIADALALSVSQLEKLEEAGVKTIGELEDLRAGAGISSIKGFGEKAVDKIENQVLDWLTENRDKFGEAVEADETTDKNLREFIEDEAAGDLDEL